MADRHLVEADDDPLRASPPEGGFDARGEGEEKEKGRREGGLRVDVKPREASPATVRSTDENLTAAELRAKYHGVSSSRSPASAAPDPADAALKFAVGKVLNTDARKRGTSVEPLSKKAVRRLVEAQLGMKPRSLDAQRKQINKYIDDFRQRIFTASYEGNVEEIEDLVRSRADVNLKNKRGNVPLQIATIQGHANVVEALLSSRANPDLRMPNGWTPLLYASWKGQTEILRGLISARAQLNLRTQDGAVALTWAAREGHVDVIKALADARADPNTRDRIQKLTPRQHAERQDKKEAVRILLQLEEQRAEERKMAEFRARLQYPEGFEESESDSKMPEADEYPPESKEEKAHRAEHKKNDKQKHTHAKRTTTTNHNGHVEIEILPKHHQHRHATRRSTLGIAPEVVAAVSTAAPLQLLEASTAKFGDHVRKCFLLEAFATVVIALMMFASPVGALGMFGLREGPKLIVDMVPIVAVFILLKGLIGLRSGGRLTLEQVETWLLIDLLYVYTLGSYVSKHPNAVTFYTTLSLIVTVLWAPIRIYWLVELRGYDSNPNSSPPQTDTLQPNQNSAREAKRMHLRNIVSGARMMYNRGGNVAGSQGGSMPAAVGASPPRRRNKASPVATSSS